MSLTSLLLNRDVKDKFASEFFYLKFSFRKSPLAPPLTNHYSLIGTAFDYLLRFYVKRLNPHAVEKQWVAESAFKLFISPMDEIVYSKAEQILKEAKSNYAKYLKTGKLTEELLKSSLKLAQLDPFHRRFLDQAPSWALQLGIIDPLDVKDLKQLIALVEPAVFKTKRRCLLNPTFGKASKMVGGADVDLILDDMMLEVKTTQFPEFKREHFDQLMGYYTLSRLVRIPAGVSSDSGDKLPLIPELSFHPRSEATQSF